MRDMGVFYCGGVWVVVFVLFFPPEQKNKVWSVTLAVDRVTGIEVTILRLLHDLDD